MQEQQLHARIAVLQQQAQSAVAAASKTQREVRRSRDTGPQLCCILSTSCFLDWAPTTCCKALHGDTAPFWA